MISIDTFKRGLNKGVTTLIELSKILIPVYVIVELLAISGILNVISNFFEPVMSVFGLPGDASLPLVLGALLNVYAGISAMLPLNLNVAQATSVAIMISIAHNLINESVVIKKVNVNPFLSAIIRIVCALLCGFIYSKLFS